MEVEYEENVPLQEPSSEDVGPRQRARPPVDRVPLFPDGIPIMKKEKLMSGSQVLGETPMSKRKGRPRKDRSPEALRAREEIRKQNSRSYMSKVREAFKDRMSKRLTTDSGWECRDCCSPNKQSAKILPITDFDSITSARCKKCKSRERDRQRQRGPRLSLVDVSGIPQGLMGPGPGLLPPTVTLAQHVPVPVLHPGAYVQPYGPQSIVEVGPPN